MGKSEQFCNNWFGKERLSESWQLQVMNAYVSSTRLLWWDSGDIVVEELAKFSGLNVVIPAADSEQLLED